MPELPFEQTLKGVMKMSVYSDFKCGALTEEEYDYLSSIEAAKDDYMPEYPLDEDREPEEEA